MDKDAGVWTFKVIAENENGREAPSKEKKVQVDLE